VLEGIGHGFRQNLEVMTAMGAAPARLVAVGGGTRNPVWLQVMSDISGMPQVLPETTIGASYGDALLAGLATGIVPGLDAARETWVRARTVIEPDPALAAMYDAHHEVFTRLYPATRDAIHGLSPDRRPR
jgi:xylulokinase